MMEDDQVALNSNRIFVKAAASMPGTTTLLAMCLTSGCGTHINPAPLPEPTWTIASGDLRFQSVSSLGATTPYEHTFQLGDEGFTSWPNYYGTPLEIGSGICGSSAGDPTDCAWGYNLNTVSSPSFSNVQTYSSDILSNLVSDPDLHSTDRVIDSLDIENTNGVFATAATSSPTASGFISHLNHVALGDLSTEVTEAGAKGQVVTAMSQDSSSTMYLLSYGWDQDSASVYDEMVISATPESLGATVQQLASQGYILTAFGGNQATGFYIVGTRLSGTSAPRSVVVSTVALSATPPLNLFASGYAVVAIIVNPGGTSSIWVLEK